MYSSYWLVLWVFVYTEREKNREKNMVMFNGTVFKSQFGGCEMMVKKRETKNKIHCGTETCETQTFKRIEG